MTTSRDLARLRPTRQTALIGLLTAVLGFAVVAQLRTADDTAFASARQEDLVRILSDLTARGDRLRGEIETLERTRRELSSGLGAEEAALTEARRRADVLGILAGTVAATGPGIVVTVVDPEGTITADVLLDVVQELRDAGAEAMELNGVRLVASSYVADDAGRVVVDGSPLVAPYVFTAVGDADTLAAAMDIPGGVVDVVASRDGASARVERRGTVLVDAVVDSARTAPASGSTSG